MKDGTSVYVWTDGKFGMKDFGYTNVVRTTNDRLEVRKKVAFPLNVKGFDEYLEPTATIDSENEEIVKLASSLVEGEDDAFKAAFILASWVEENVEYDLSSLTAATSQKASWVLEQRRGVCDEMTSLFVAMARSVGIPARFVSGISYTSSDLFSEPWQPHGWAEIYLPDVGWVSFDITFNQYGYVDVTHIKLRDGFDPKEPATKFEWTATKNQVDLEPLPLEFDVKIKDKGTYIPEEISLEMEILESEVGFGSFNLVKGIVKNNADYYAATALNLAVPEEISVVGRNRRNILLRPKEVRETFWVMEVPTSLPEQYVFTFPTLIYSEKNMSVEEVFTAAVNGRVYSKKDIESLTVKDEEKSYSRKVQFDCDFPEVMKIGEEKKFSCSVKNVGNANLDDVTFCLDGVCDKVDLAISKSASQEVTVKAEKEGWESVVVRVENELIEKTESLAYKVLDTAAVDVSLKGPSLITYGDSFTLEVVVDKKSFQVPQEVVIVLEGDGFAQKWELDSLETEQTLTLQLQDYPLQFSNEFEVSVMWKDVVGEEYDAAERIEVSGAGSGFGEKVAMLFNGFLGLFS